jgi:hypothetical protein
MTIVDHVTSDVPDLLSLHGNLAPASHAVPNATLSFLFRRGQPFPGTPSLNWNITCERGEIRVISPTSMTLQTRENDRPITIQVHHFDNDEVEDVAWDWSDRQREVPIIGRDVMECLYAFADRKAEGDGWVGLEDAARYAQLIESFLEV